MSTLVAALRSADLTPSGWLSPVNRRRIRAMTRRSPPRWSGTNSVNPRHRRAGRGQQSWASAHRFGHHAVLWIGEVAQVAGLSRLPVTGAVLSTGIQRSFSLICTPVRSDQAARDIRKKKVEHISDQAQRAKIGQIEDSAQTAEYHDVLQQEADLTAGHGILRYTGLISVSAPSVEELEAGVAAIEQAAIQSSCETRLLVGQQAAAFTAAALPLCRRV